MKVKIKIPTSFDINFMRIYKSIPCSVQIIDDTMLHNKKEGKFQIQNTCSGYIKVEDQCIANAVITFYKPNIKQPNTIDYDTNHYTDGINGVKNWHWNNTFDIHSENIIVDKVVSNAEGYYTAFVKNGIYDILVQYNGQSELLKNQEITDGIEEEFYYMIDGNITQKLNSTYIMVNEWARNIKLNLLNQYLHITDGEIIITQNDILKVYTSTKNMFALIPGIYDIRIRNNDVQLLYIKDFEFKMDMDFVDALLDYINDNDIQIIQPIITEEEINDEYKNDETIITT